MHSLALIGGLFCLAIWIYLLAVHGGFWRVASLQVGVQVHGAIDGEVAVVIPARDEASVIGPTVRSLLRQTCAHSIHLFVVDDHSSDETSEVCA